MTEEMAGWHHQFNGHELGQTLREVRDREASVSGMLACCSPGGRKESYTTWQLNNNNSFSLMY